VYHDDLPGRIAAEVLINRSKFEFDGAKKRREDVFTSLKSPRRKRENERDIDIERV
jgi:hypothetical protein